jgi:hypothetical protein
MARGLATRHFLAAVGLICFALSGCSSDSFVNNPSRWVDLFKTYPVGPVNQNFTCFGPKHKIADDAVKACFGSGLKDDDALLADGKTCEETCKKSEKDANQCEKCETDLLKHAFASDGLQETACTGAENVSNCVDEALECTAAARNSYADFLNCREDFQTTAGVGIATLFAASAPVTLGASAVAGVALAGVASTGLGLDYVVYNSAKSAAYATATAQLQCVIYDSSNIVRTLDPL